MKKFRVSVNGEVFDVVVEEVVGDNQPPVHGRNTPSTPILTPPKPMVPAATTSVKAADPGPVSAPPVRTGGPGTAATGGEVVAAPLPGTIADIKVSSGQNVKEGDLLLILEAMKMENEVASPRGGVVKELLVVKGQSVNSGDPLLVIG